MFQEQPLLLEDLLEQEKREQEKQLQTQPLSNNSSNNNSNSDLSSNQATNQALFTDHEFERIKADVFNSSSITGINSSTAQAVPGLILIF